MTREKSNASDPIFPVAGLDFSSRPTPSKPLIFTEGERRGEKLRIHRVRRFASLDELEEVLSNYSGVLGVDCPFALPRSFLDRCPALRGKSWPEILGTLADLGPERGAELLLSEAAHRRKGERQALRLTDQLAGASSPLRVRNEPFTGKMFLRWAPILRRLREAGAVVWPFDRDRSLDTKTNTALTLIEVYPNLAARAFVPNLPYKNRSAEDSQTRGVRRIMLQRMAAGFVQSIYGTRVELPPEVIPPIIDDPGADRLDSLLCALQAAAFPLRPALADLPEQALTEGWILDPHLAPIL